MCDLQIMKMDDETILLVGNEKIPVDDYSIKSSADGTTELTLSIKGVATIFEMSASLK